MAITKVWINEKKKRCIACGLCELIAPTVFKVTNVTSILKDADLDEVQAEIKDAVEGCPQNIIECK